MFRVVPHTSGSANLSVAQWRSVALRMRRMQVRLLPGRHRRVTDLESRLTVNQLLRRSRFDPCHTHMTDLQFQTSTFCESSGCVGFAIGPVVGGGHMEIEYNPDTQRWYVRREDQPDGPQLEFTQGEWDAFTQGAKAGQFNL